MIREAGQMTSEPTLDMLGKYRILAYLGRGGMAEVFKASVTGVGGFNKIVVIKRILPELQHDRKYIKMFLDEARIQALLNHANIVQVFDIDMVDSIPHMAMEYAGGPTLRQILKRARQERKIHYGHMARVCSLIAGGLDHAHRAKTPEGKHLELVHRDVSPHNIIVTMDGVPKLLDFGVAKAEGRSTETKDGDIKGKFAYMAPEQINGLPATPRSDVYSLGVTLYLCTVGKPPYRGQTAVEILRDALVGKFKRPRERIRDYPEMLERIVLWAMRRDPDKRCPNAATMHNALEKFINSGPYQSTTSSFVQWLEELFPNADTFEASAHGAYVAADASDSGGSLSPSLSSSMSPTGSTPGSTSGSYSYPRAGVPPGAERINAPIGDSWAVPSARDAVTTREVPTTVVGAGVKPAESRKPMLWAALLILLLGTAGGVVSVAVGDEPVVGTATVERTTAAPPAREAVPDEVEELHESVTADKPAPAASPGKTLPEAHATSSPTRENKKRGRAKPLKGMRAAAPAPKHPATATKSSPNRTTVDAEPRGDAPEVNDALPVGEHLVEKRTEGSVGGIEDGEVETRPQDKLVVESEATSVRKAPPSATIDPSDFPPPRLPQRRHVERIEMVIRIFRMVEEEVGHNSGQRQKANAVTLPLARALAGSMPASGVELYPASMYYFVMRQLKEGKAKSMIGERLKDAHFNGALK